VGDVQKYMLKMVHERRNADVKVERDDLLSGLLSASEEEFRGSATLTDQEVISECSHNIT
jgi:cytochrome P450